MRSRHPLWCGSLLLAAAALAQPPLYLKPGSAQALEWPGSGWAGKRKDAARRHLILQFETPPGEWQLGELARRGVQIVGYVPENGLAVSLPDHAPLAEDLGIVHSATFAPEAKISALAAAAGPETRHWVVDFHADVGPAAAREIVTGTGLRIHEHPDLLEHQLVVVARPDQLLELAEWDEVAYIYPASRDLAEGRPVVACAGAAASSAAVGQYVAQVGRGWSAGPSGTVQLQYHFGALSAKVPSGQTREEIERALGEWARHAKLNFTPGSSATASRTIHILFAAGAHGDPFPFDGRGKALAHTFYPSPPNAEPLAGDIHLDDDENWRIGADTDVYSVVLHELGHALGLGHSDNPGAVMYPFYRRAETLTEEDVNALRLLYPARDTTAGGSPSAPAGPAPPSPLQLAITSPGPESSTQAGSVAVEGTLSGGAAPLALAWSTDRGAAGTAAAAPVWRIAEVPLSPGRNVIRVAVTDADQQRVERSVAVIREIPLPARPVTDTVAPSLSIHSPAGASVLVAAPTITLRGSARDNTGVAQVTWSSSSGRSGTAQGTAAWTIPDLPLLVGANTVVVRARDAAGNTAWRSVVITRR